MLGHWIIRWPRHRYYALADRGPSMTDNEMESAIYKSLMICPAGLFENCRGFDVRAVDSLGQEMEGELGGAVWVFCR